MKSIRTSPPLLADVQAMLAKFDEMRRHDRPDAATQFVL